MKNGIKSYFSPEGLVRWKVNVQIQGFRLRKQNFFNKKEASAFLERMRLLIITGHYENFLEEEKKKKFNESKDISFERYARTLFDSKKCNDIRSTTHNRYMFALESNVFSLLKGKSLRSVSSKDLEAIKQGMLAKGSQRTSINSPISAVLYVLKRACEEGLIEERIKNPVKFVQAKRNIFLTDVELTNLLRVVDCKLKEKQLWFKVYVHLQLNTFARVGELLALNWEDIDFENKTIAINKQVDMYSLKLAPTKNNRIHNALPLNDDMIKLLRQYKIQCGFCRIVFPTAHYFSAGKDSKNKKKINAPRMKRNGVHAMLKKSALLAGIDASRLSSHILRKTAGDRLLRSGMTVHQVAHALRIDAKTVLWTYSTLDESAFDAKLKDFVLVKSGSTAAMNDNVETLEVQKD